MFCAFITMTTLDVVVLVMERNHCKEKKERETIFLEYMYIVKNTYTHTHTPRETEKITHTRKYEFYIYH